METALRTGRWVTWALMALYFLGCLRDLYYFEFWNERDPKIWAAMLGFIFGGLALIWAISKGIGWVVRRLMRLPPVPGPVKGAGPQA